jgi:hypothetical protein
LMYHVKHGGQGSFQLKASGFQKMTLLLYKENEEVKY